MKATIKCYPADLKAVITTTVPVKSILIIVVEVSRQALLQRVFSRGHLLYFPYLLYSHEVLLGGQIIRQAVDRAISIILHSNTRTCLDLLSPSINSASPLLVDFHRCWLPTRTLEGFGEGRIFRKKRLVLGIRTLERLPAGVAVSCEPTTAVSSYTTVRSAALES